MAAKDGALKVIGQVGTPCGDGLAYDIVTALGRALAIQGSVCLAGGDGHGRLDYCDPVAVKITFWPIGRLNDLASSGAVGRLSGDEEGAVAAEAGGIALHLGDADIQAEALVEQSDHEGSVG